MSQFAIIIGAGPAGLTAAYEFINRTEIIPIILEKSGDIGGLSKTINYKGNRIDIGGHRFFSKSETIMKWWQNILPIEGASSTNDLLKEINYQNKRNTVILSPNGPDPEKTDKVMLIRKRLSRIYFLRKFFDYPITLNKKTVSQLGFNRIIKIGYTYLCIKLFPKKKIHSLEDFFISRFGKELYETFFKDYTEKVWGVSCNDIPADWGAQRIKQLSVSRALLHAIKSIFKIEKSIEQKDTDTSLIEQFMYPKFGPGQMWETVAEIIKSKGCKIITNAEVIGINWNNNKITGIKYKNTIDNTTTVLDGDYFFSTMPVKELIKAFGNDVPENVKQISEGLKYRDFITVGLLLNKLKINNETKVKTLNNQILDNWIYVQEKDVKVGRIQIFNNWSPYMVSNIDKVWLGMEYFCNENDLLWQKNDIDFINFAIDELQKIEIIDRADVIDSTIIRVAKTYPAYFGTYAKFNVVKNFCDQKENLFLIGRNGMHKYNNQDHSMLTAITAVNNIIEGIDSKDNIWDINTEEFYHEKS
jgi:protoporphyrinogen oxidase